MVGLVFGVGGVGPEVGHGGFCELGGGGWNGCLGLVEGGSRQCTLGGM